MQNQTLNGYWQVRQVDTQDWLPACVPGGVHTDLMAAGRLADPFYGTNEEQAQWVAERTWEYRRFFYPLPSIFRQEKIWLVCDGLDTLAEVRLNGKILGQANNMYRSWRWEIKEFLKEGENRLEILFRSPVGYVRSRERVRRLGGMNMGINGGPHLRKAASHFGWDWGPRLPCIGIWQEVRLEGASRGKLVDIRFDQEHAPGVVTLTARVQCELWEQSEFNPTVRLRLTAPDRQMMQLDSPARPLTGHARQAILTVTIPNPHIWWPNGYGAQHLYTAEVELLGSEDMLIDTRECRLGLRTIELRQDPLTSTPTGPALPAAQPAGAAGSEINLPAPETGKATKDPSSTGRSFTFVVNGVPVFCKGSNWIPADSFPTRITTEQVERLIGAAAETHQNMLRVWGGGFYESDAFYDLCDRYGMLVWQDFQFACAVYPLDDPAYLENVRAEVIENVRRLRHHACLALWCGNNEIEWLSQRLGWYRLRRALREAFQQFFFQQLPEILDAEDACHPYWPGSPTCSSPFNDPNNVNTGDAHLWEVFGGLHPVRNYRRSTPCFVSEFGFQGLPALETIQQFTPPEALQWNSAILRSHQRAFGGNSRLVWYLAQRFRLPRTLEGQVYLSQVMQAEAVRTGVEHWRQHPERTSGVLYWQLNDCWPVISWSSIDYYGRWKALHYLARRFFAPVLLSVEDETGRRARKMAVWVTNDSCAPWQGLVHWSLETLDGEVIEGGDQPLLAAAQSAQCLLRLDFSHHQGKVDWKRVIFVAELWQGSTRTALQVSPFVAEKYLPAADPGLRTEIFQAGARLLIRVSASRLARFVEVSLEGAITQFSDNFFDLPAGRIESVECELPDGWTLEQAQAALRVRSLNEIGPSDSLMLTGWKGRLALLGCLGEMFWKGAIEPIFRR